MSTIQCYLPQLAFDALDHALIKATARYAGVEDARYESSTFRIPNTQPPGSVRITVNDRMARCLVEALKQQVEKADAKPNARLAQASRVATERLSAALDAAYTPRNLSPGFGPNS